MNVADHLKLVDDARRAVQAGQPLPPAVENYNRAMKKIGALPITGNEQ